MRSYTRLEVFMDNSEGFIIIAFPNDENDHNRSMYYSTHNIWQIKF